MIIFEIAEDKFGKLMKSVSKIKEHAECLHDLFEDLSEESEYGDRYSKYDDNMYGSRYGMRRGNRR